MYGPQNLTMPGETRLAAPAARVAGHRDRPGRGAVVAAVRREDLVAAGVQAGHADGVLGGLGTAVGEEHHVEVAGRQLADQPGGLAAGVVGVDRGDRAELVGLLLDRRHQLGVLVADVDVDELAGEVEEAVAPVVPEARSLGAGDDERVEAWPAPTTSGRRGHGRRRRPASVRVAMAGAVMGPRYSIPLGPNRVPIVTEQTTTILSRVARARREFNSGESRAPSTA